MKKGFSKFLIFFLALFSTTSIPVNAKKGGEIADPNLRLHYNSPAKLWEETLPLGNGRLGMFHYLD